MRTYPLIFLTPSLSHWLRQINNKQTNFQVRLLTVSFRIYTFLHYFNMKKTVTFNHFHIKDKRNVIITRFCWIFTGIREYIRNKNDNNDSNIFAVFKLFFLEYERRIFANIRYIFVNTRYSWKLYNPRAKIFIIFVYLI